MLRQTKIILEMIKFSHTLFALPFAALSAVWATHAYPEWSWSDVVLVLPCMVLARTTAMCFNRLADRRIDAVNPRTATRALPAGLLGVWSVAAFTLVSAGLFVLTTALFSNPWPLRLSVPVLAFVCLYSYAKRVTWLSHVWLGAALMLAPVCTWVAITGHIDWAPVMLGLAVLFWVSGFDIIYALQDVTFDEQAGLKSMPIRFGISGSLWLAWLFHVLMIACLVVLLWLFPLGWLYAAAVAAVAILIAYEHAIVRPDRLDKVNVAFFHVNAIVSAALLAAGGADVVLGLGPLFV